MSDKLLKMIVADMQLGREPSLWTRFHYATYKRYEQCQ